MSQRTYTILIGSFARGQGGEDSDIDILRIGHSHPVKVPVEVGFDVPISYIDYDYPVFTNLYNRGSLFLFHSFKEGKLIEGNEESWQKLRCNFVVSKDHKGIINEYCELLKFIGAYPGYEQAFMAYLSNVFKALKNIGIFKLAQKGQYVFDKKKALIDGCGLSLFQANILISCNNSFERARGLSDEDTSQLKKFAQSWKLTHNKLVEGLSNDR